MDIEIKPLEKRDYNKVIDFAIKGMNFKKYTSNTIALKLYGRYFLYLELERATQVLAAYKNDELLGVLLADMMNEPKYHSSIWRKLYISIFSFTMNIFFSKGSDIYDKTNKKMLNRFLHSNTPDGEICFLAANPKIKRTGVGSVLLSELATREKDKLIYLYTDSNCTYQFYEKKGFSREQEEEILMDMGKNSVPLTCFLYKKKLVI